MHVIAEPDQQVKPLSDDSLSRAFMTHVTVVSAFVLLFMVAVTFGFSPRYETIDDIVMHEYVAGLFFSRAPDEHMIYSHVLIGKVLSWLYSTESGVPWYPIYQLCALFGASTVICSAFVKLYGARGALVPSLIYALVILAPSIICMQFTVTAAVVGIAGGVLLEAAIESKADLKWRWLLASCSAFAFVFASLIRQKAGWMVAVLFGIYLVTRYLGKPGKRLTLALGVTVALALVSQLFWVANDEYYRRTGWGEFEVWRRKLHPLYDFSRLDLKSVASIERVGWSSNDVKMLNTCMHWDDNVFSTERLSALVEQGHSFMRFDWQTYLPRAARRLSNYPGAQIVIFWLVGSFLLTSTQKLSTVRFSALIAAVFCLATVVTITHKASLHVYLPMLYMLAVARLMSVNFNSPRPEGKMRAAVTAVSLLILVGCAEFFICFLKDHEARRQKMVNDTANRRQDLFTIANRYPDKLAFTVVGAPGLLPFEDTKPLKNLRVVSSYSSRMSFGKELLAAHQIPDFGQGLLSGKALVVSNYKLNEILAAFCLEHYGINVHFRRLPRGGSPREGVYEVVASR